MSDRSPEESVTILLVEDNPGDVRLTREAFKSIDLQAELQVVTDGGEAVQYIQGHFADEPAHPLDLILLDLNLPRVDGFEVLDYLNDEIRTPSPPVLILSSSGTADDVEQSYQKGTNAYLTKPDTMGDFEAMAESIKEFWLEWVQHPPTSVESG